MKEQLYICTAALILYISDESLKGVSIVAVNQNDGCAKLSLAYIEIMRSVIHGNDTRWQHLLNNAYC